MVLVDALSRLGVARIVAAWLACAGCLLAFASGASAVVDQTISYTPPSGKSATTTGGTSSYLGNDSVEEDTTVDLYTGSAKTLGTGLECNPANIARQCDYYDLFGSGTVKPEPPCAAEGFDVYCPDAEFFTAKLGSGNNDSITYFEPLQYQKATVTTGGGENDFAEGTDPSEFGEFPDVDEFIGGAGKDILVGGPGDDILKGGPGNDVLDGRGGNDLLYGEAGNDEIYGGPGASLEAGGEGSNKLGYEFWLGTPDAGKYDPGNETFDGSGGSSTVSFEGAPGPVSAKVDGAPDSGIAGQADTIETNIAEVDGSGNGDTLTAGTTPVTLDGEGGNDTIYGGPGGDTLRGGAGDNTIHTAGPAGVGPDSIFAAETFCNLEISCPTGNTTIYANDGIEDQISCAPGADVVYADTIDVVSTAAIFGCTTVNRSGSAPGTTGPATTVAGAVAGTSSVAHVKTKGNSASLTLACAGAGSSSCVDTFTLSVVETLRSGKLIAVAAASKIKKKTVTIGHATVTLGGGQSKTVSVSLNAGGRALLKSRHKLAAKLVLTQTSGGKTVAVKGQTVTFVAPKHH